MKLLHKQLLDVFAHMISARRLDELEESYTQRGLAHFQVSGKGHEGSAILSPLLIRDDWLHCHYRDKALMLARGVSEEKFFDGLFSNGASCSKGRQMSAHLSDRATNIMSIVGPVGNHALQAVGVAHEIKRHDSNPLVLCAMGEGTTQEGEVYEALAEAVRSQLPVLFFIEDNQYAISTDTRGKTFYSTPYGEMDEYCGIEVVRIDGWDVVNAFEKLRRTIDLIRKNRKPQIVVFNVKRLSNHTNADDQAAYKPEARLKEEQTVFDPVENLERHLIDAGFEQDVLRLKRAAENRVKKAAKSALNKETPTVSLQSKRPFDDSQPAGLGSFPPRDFGEINTMRESIKSVLRFQLAHNPNVVLYGEDIEDPKGDVFGVTKGLSQAFPERVVNSPLSESTIVGVSTGRALAGARPVAFIQFADFLPLAFNQIVSELATMYWRTDGEWQSPVIIMVSCGAYRPGLGPYHANTFESLFAHIPGLDVMMPSSPHDAAELLITAFESQRPTLFFYPKSLLNVEESRSALGGLYARLPYGKARQLHKGDSVTIVSWGSTVPICKEAVNALADKGMSCDLYDLRFMSPWDSGSIIKSVQKTGRLLVCHEDNLTCGMGAEVVASVTEVIETPIKVKRITRPDVFIPCNYDNQVELLPSYRALVEAVVDLTGGGVEWQCDVEPSHDEGVMTLDAMGTSPSDDTVTVLEYYVQKGQHFEEGEPLVMVEANKAITDICAHEGGTVLDLVVDEDEVVKVGEPLIRYAPDEIQKRPSYALKRDAQKVDFEINFLEANVLSAPFLAEDDERMVPGIASVAVELGALTVPNKQISKSLSGVSESELFKLTGIKSRRWVDKEQSALSMAVNAIKNLLFETGISLSAIDKLIVSTGTPEEVTPSMASSILGLLSQDAGVGDMSAFDINAACSGYLYGLEAASSYLQLYPEKRVLLVTTEVLSSKLNPEDKSTFPIFADAATATLISGYKTGDRVKGVITETYLGSTPDRKRSLVVPSKNMGNLSMEGREVFSEAIRSMKKALERVCENRGVTLDSLDLIIPHQANQRIIDGLGKRLGRMDGSIYSNIAKIGNTSSNSIPVALAEVFEEEKPNGKVALCAFGGGFTYGAALIEI